MSSPAATNDRPSTDDRCRLPDSQLDPTVGPTRQTTTTEGASMAAVFPAPQSDPSDLSLDLDTFAATLSGTPDPTRQPRLRRGSSNQQHDCRSPSGRHRSRGRRRRRRPDGGLRRRDRPRARGSRRRPQHSRLQRDRRDHARPVGDEGSPHRRRSAPRLGAARPDRDRVHDGGRGPRSRDAVRRHGLRRDRRVDARWR